MPSHNRRIRRAVAALAALSMLAAACGSNENDDDVNAAATPADTRTEPDEPADSGEPIRIGAILDFTGPFTAASPSFRDGLEAWATSINEGGGIKGRPIELVLEDGQADPNAASAAATKLISQDKVFAIACVLGSSAALAAADVAAAEGVVVLPCAYSDGLFDPVRPNVFVAAAGYGSQIARGVEVLAEETNATKVAVVHSSDEFGDSGLAGARDAFEALQIDEVASEAFERGAQDLQAQAQAVLRSEPDFVVCVCVYSQSGLLAQALTRLGAADVPILAPNPTVGPPFFAVAGEAGGSVYAADYVAHDGTVGWDAAADAMQTAFARDPNSLELLGMLNMAVLTTALGEIDGSLTSESLIAALESFDEQEVPGLAVPVSFSADRHIASDSVAVYRADVAEEGWTLVAEPAASSSR